MSILSGEYSKVVENSERVSWKLTDVFPKDAKLDFKKNFMPSAMFASGSLPFLGADEKRKLNQIFGAAYAHLFGFVEVYITDLALRQASAALGQGTDTLRALCRFADEEVKHQRMFERFGQLFAAGFGTTTEVVGDPKGVAGFILGKSMLGALLVTLHLEIITQAHYTDAIRDGSDIDPLFQSLFKFHWMEESQHAKIDALELTRLRKAASDEAVAQTVKDYFDVAGAFAGLLAAQAKNDVVSLERAIGRTLSDSEKQAVEQAQTKSYHRAFLGSGVTNPSFLEFVAQHFPAALPGCKQAAEAFA
jgi:hypothetical protein